MHTLEKKEKLHVFKFTENDMSKMVNATLSNLLPENSFKDIAYSERGLNEHHNQDHVRPSKLAKLILVLPFL